MLGAGQGDGMETGDGDGDGMSVEDAIYSAIEKIVL